MELALTFLWTLNFRHNSHMCFFKAALWIIHVPFTKESPWERWHLCPACCIYYAPPTSAMPLLPSCPHTGLLSLTFSTTRFHALQGSRHPSGPVESLQLGQPWSLPPRPPPPSRESDVKVKDLEHGARLAPPLSLSEHLLPMLCSSL